MRELTIVENGKLLEDMIYEVDVLRKTIIVSGNNDGCIAWQEEGMLAYFTYEDGYPCIYWSEKIGASKESFTSLSRFIEYIRSRSIGRPDGEFHYILTVPIWKVMEAENEPKREAFNSLLGDIEIDL